jgi:serine/threonine protein kinase
MMANDPGQHPPFPNYAGETLPAAYQGDLAAQRSTEALVAPVWQVGETILSTYEVADIIGEGGMGTVYRVHHRGWHLDLAVKCPRSEAFTQADSIAQFTREAETWVSLELHPHITSCYYVRILGGIPRVFTEYVAGGSLKTSLTQRRLTTLGALLDVAIQTTWGLQTAHDQGLIHRDVKPANILMTPDGMPK